MTTTGGRTAARIGEEPMRVAIVDDEPLARDLLRRHVEGHPDLVLVGEAGSGSEGARLVEEKGPDVVLLDIQMPEGGGFEVLETFAPLVGTFL